MKFQTQAVLRRDDMQAPLRLVGVLLAGSFYPDRPSDAWGPLHLEAGYVALAPLSPVVDEEPEQGAQRALLEAREQWADRNAPLHSDALAWRAIGGVRQTLAGEGPTVRQLIDELGAADDARVESQPSTPPYHAAAREIERLATAIYDVTSTEERVAEDTAAARAKSARGHVDA
jgi:hypothetical protein